MSDLYLLLTPIAALAVVALFRFVGCDLIFTIPDRPVDHPYPAGVLEDGPVSYWRLQEPAGATEAKDEIGLANGTYGTAPSPLAAGSPEFKSNAADPTIVQPGVTEPPLLIKVPEEAQNNGELPETAVRVHGGFIQVPFRGPLNPQVFTLEAVVLPEWDLSILGKFYCVLESSSPLLGDPMAAKKTGYAVYGGPDDPDDPTSHYHWQFWVGTGTGFVRLTEQKPYKHPVNDQGVPNPGPSIVNAPTYLAFTYDGNQAMLYAYTEDTDFDFARYDLNVVPYSAAGQVDLFIGISGPSRRALFSPPGPDQFLYPFHGRIVEVAIYDKILGVEQVASHASSAFHR